ncbi:hypothetical protein OOK36_52845 [Streptomyces sp. NBC_00365]|nr:hypothetical protein [Streptomyces sp. NBC_00365]MCX5097214.1 hypothetical protein [Streptomyces sp. NBC_00365]
MDPCRPAPWTLRLQTARLGSIQQARGIKLAVRYEATVLVAAINEWL